eukprot:2813105-Pyramimonas_sp.AAC.1
MPITQQNGSQMPSYRRNRYALGPSTGPSIIGGADLPPRPPGTSEQSIYRVDPCVRLAVSDWQRTDPP